MKRRILSVLCCLVLLSLLPMTAFAIEIPDLDRRGSISITMTYQDKVVRGGTLTIYRVADVHVENGADYSFRYTQDYANCEAPLDLISVSETAQTIAEYTKKNKISGTTVKIDNKGKITFENLEPGLYLLVQQKASSGYKALSPFLVSVPGRVDDHYVYDVDASPKLALEPAPREPYEPPPNIPQTGLNQWPILALGVGGLLLLVLGMMFIISGKKKNHEG